MADLNYTYDVINSYFSDTLTESETINAIEDDRFDLAFSECVLELSEAMEDKDLSEEAQVMGIIAYFEDEISTEEFESFIESGLLDIDVVEAFFENAEEDEEFYEGIKDAFNNFASSMKEKYNRTAGNVMKSGADYASEKGKDKLAQKLYGSASKFYKSSGDKKESFKANVKSKYSGAKAFVKDVKDKLTGQDKEPSLKDKIKSKLFKK